MIAFWDDVPVTLALPARNADDFLTLDDVLRNLNEDRTDTARNSINLQNCGDKGLSYPAAPDTTRVSSGLSFIS